MNFSKMLASTAIVLVASLIIGSEAGQYRCHGYGCGASSQPAYLPSAPLPAPQYRAPHGPYHSYAVRPAVYGGPRLYSYRGYARHPLPAPAPVSVHLKAAAYSPYSHAPIVAPLTLAIETAVHHAGPVYGGHAAAPLRPVKAVLLAPVVAHAAPLAPLRQPAYPNRQHRARRPSYQGALYRGEAPRPAAYGSGHYYQALDNLKARGAYHPATSGSANYKSHKSAQAGGY